MRTFRTLAFVLLCSTLSAQTPITLSNNNMPVAGDTLRFTSVSVNSIGNYTQTGTNFNWSFLSVTSTTEGVRAYKSALQTPYALFFLSFTGFAEKLSDINLGLFSFTDYYNFYKKQTSPQAFIADGVGMTFSSVPLPSYYTDKDEIYNFPMTYPKYDSTTFRFTTPSSTIIPIIYTKRGYRVTKVDGWGTVTTPYGTETCLRLITTQYATDSIKSTILPIPFAFPNVTRSYQWMTLNSKIPYFEVSGSVLAGNFTPTTARYRGYKINGPDPNPVGLNTYENEAPIVVYPNPVSDRLTFGRIKSDAECGLYDAQGKLLRIISLKAGTADAGVDVQDLEKGIYSLQIRSEGQQIQLKFVKD